MSKVTVAEAVDKPATVTIELSLDEARLLKTRMGFDSHERRDIDGFTRAQGSAIYGIYSNLVDVLAAQETLGGLVQ